MPKYLYRASSAPHLEECPKFRPKPFDESDDTKRGTEIHNLTWECLLGNDVSGDPDCEEITESAEWVLSFTAEHAPGADIYCERKGPCSKCGTVPTPRTNTLEDGRTVHVWGDECDKCGTHLPGYSVVTDPNTFEPVTGGTTDVYAVGEKRVVVIDLKSGFDFNVEGHYHRPQTVTYGLAIMEQYGKTEALIAERYVLPKQKRYYMVTLEEARNEVFGLVAKVRDPNARARRCNYCGYCADILACPAVDTRQKVLSECFDQADDIDTRTLREPETIEDPEEMSAALTFSTVTMTAYIKRLLEVQKNVKVAALAMHDSGKEIPHFKKKTRRGSRVITDSQAAVEYATNAGVGAEDIAALAKVPLGKLQDMLYSAMKPNDSAVTKKSIQEMVDEDLGDIIVRQSDSAWMERG